MATRPLRAVLEDVRVCIQWALMFLLMANMVVWMAGHYGGFWLNVVSAAVGVVAYFAAGRPKVSNG